MTGEQAKRFPLAEAEILLFEAEDRILRTQKALDYSLEDLPWPEKSLTGAAGRIWQSHMNAWNAAHGR